MLTNVYTLEERLNCVSSGTILNSSVAQRNAVVIYTALAQPAERKCTHVLCILHAHSRVITISKESSLDATDFSRRTHWQDVYAHASSTRSPLTLLQYINATQRPCIFDQMEDLRELHRQFERCSRGVIRIIGSSAGVDTGKTGESDFNGRVRLRRVSHAIRRALAASGR